MRGVSLRQRRDGGSTNFRKQSANSIIFLCLPFLFFALFCEGYAGDALPPVPLKRTGTTPLTSAGGKDVYRIGTARHCPNSPTNSNLPCHGTITSGAQRQNDHRPRLSRLVRRHCWPPLDSLHTQNDTERCPKAERSQTTFVTTCPPALPATT